MSTLADEIRAGATVDDLRVSAAATRAAELARHAYHAPATLAALAADLRAFRDSHTTLAQDGYTALAFLIDVVDALAVRYVGAARLDTAGEPELLDATLDPTRELLAALHDVTEALA